jgi:hypothetical protein
MVPFAGLPSVAGRRAVLPPDLGELQVVAPAAPDADPAPGGRRPGQYNSTPKNINEFLVGRNGKVVNRYEPMVKPEAIGPSGS